MLVRKTSAKAESDAADKPERISVEATSTQILANADSGCKPLKTPRFLKIDVTDTYQGLIVHKPFKKGALATRICALSTGAKLLSGLGQFGAWRCVHLGWNQVLSPSTGGQNSLTWCPLRKMQCPFLNAPAITREPRCPFSWKDRPGKLEPDLCQSGRNVVYFRRSHGLHGSYYLCLMISGQHCLDPKSFTQSSLELVGCPVVEVSHVGGIHCT